VHMTTHYSGILRTQRALSHRLRNQRMNEITLQGQCRHFPALGRPALSYPSPATRAAPALRPLPAAERPLAAAREGQGAVTARGGVGDATSWGVTPPGR
jgi:hypothetical protein